MSVSRFFAPDAGSESATVALSDEEAHHLLHVLRLGAGAAIGVFDGRGREWAARVVGADKKNGVSVQLEQPIAAVAEPPVKLTLALALLKGDQMDAVVRDATMLGVATIVPFISEHVVVPARAWKADGALIRWRRVAVASAKQCGRAVVPAVETVTTFDSLIGKSDALKLMCVEPAHARGETSALSAAPRPAAATAFIGPEGGWSAREIAQAQDAAAQLIHLGPRTLRAETAPTVLLSSLWTVWGWQ